MGVRIVNAAIYLGLALLGAAAIGGPLRLALTAVASRYSYAPNLTLPWLWLLIAAALVAVLYSATSLLAQGLKAGLKRYLLLIVIVAAAFAVGRSVTAPSRPTLDDGLSHLVARVELAADAGFSHDKRYPADAAALTAQWPADLLDLGFYRRGGLPLRSELHVLPDVYGPVLLAPPGTRPGDVVYAIAPDHRRYWITAFVLNRFGRLVPLADANGRAVVAAAADGHPASRMDPLFPDYPNKMPVRGPPG